MHCKSCQRSFRADASYDPAQWRIENDCAMVKIEVVVEGTCGSSGVSASVREEHTSAQESLLKHRALPPKSGKSRLRPRWL
jgi:hypothetical protein